MSAPSPSSFSFEPLFLVLVAGAAVAYARVSRHRRPGKRAILFGLGLALVATALNSPLETIAVHYLVLVHLLQNVMIADWAPPLLILGLTPAMRATLARSGGRAFALVTRPKIALPLWLIAWYGIHLAAFYDFALRNPGALNVEHAFLIAVGTVFWWPVLSDTPHPLSAAVRVAYLAAAFVGSTFLGLALTFSSQPFYDYYAAAPRLWGLSVIEDQNLGGVLMSAEQALVFLAVIAYFVVRLVPDAEEPTAGSPGKG